MQVVSSLLFNFVVYKYRYRSAGTEVWQDDRLVELDNNADFNGSKYAVVARRSNSGLDVTVNGETSSLPHDAWTTSYWRLPQSLASEFPGDPGESPIVRTNGAPPRKIVLLDSDKGEQRRAEVIRLNDERLSVGGDDRVCSHYRLSGDVQVDLWYDGQRRLVRQESVEQGHKTAIHLTNITAD